MLSGIEVRLRQYFHCMRTLRFILTKFNGTGWRMTAAGRTFQSAETTGDWNPLTSAAAGVSRARKTVTLVLALTCVLTHAGWAADNSSVEVRAGGLGETRPTFE